MHTGCIRPTVLGSSWQVIFDAYINITVCLYAYKLWPAGISYGLPGEAG